MARRREHFPTVVAVDDAEPKVSAFDEALAWAEGNSEAQRILVCLPEAARKRVAVRLFQDWQLGRPLQPARFEAKAKAEAEERRRMVDLAEWRRREAENCRAILSAQELAKLRSDWQNVQEMRNRKGEKPDAGSPTGKRWAEIEKRAAEAGLGNGCADKFYDQALAEAAERAFPGKGPGVEAQRLAWRRHNQGQQPTRADIRLKGRAQELREAAARIEAVHIEANAAYEAKRKAAMEGA